jgi:hypothetical protein
MNVERLRDAGLIQPPLFVLVNCRPDRVERNGQMGEILPKLEADKAFVIGHPVRSAIAAIPNEWEGDVIDLGGDRGPGEILGSILAEVEYEASLVAVGNIHGQGELLLHHLETLRRAG